MKCRDDFNREGRPREVRRLNQLLETKVQSWGERWQLEGSYVRCRACGGQQPISETGNVFHRNHANTCIFYASPSQTPLGELADILSGWHFELWEEERELE
jgi:hypothetical protein